MIQAVIFDLDGTVLDNEYKWEEAFRGVANRNGIRCPLVGNRWIHEPGIGISPNWEKLVEKGDRADKLSRETWELYQMEYSQSLSLREGIVELVSAIKEKGWLTALATGSNWDVVEKELEQLDMYLAFDVTTTGEEVLAQKPDPEIYLLTSQKLGVDPEECVVIEDSLAGVQAAVDAGMKVVAITSDYATREGFEKLWGYLPAGRQDLLVDYLNEVMVVLAHHGSESKV